MPLRAVMIMMAIYSQFEDGMVYVMNLTISNWFHFIDFCSLPSSAPSPSSGRPDQGHL